MSRLSSFVRARTAAWSNASRQPGAYWAKRQDSIYLQYVYFLARVVGRDARSVIDVGSNGCAYLEWLDWIPRKVSLDLKNPYHSATVEGIRGDFLTTPIVGRFDLCLCLQVLEHIPEVEPFARKLLGLAPHLIVSVPHKWPAGRPDHIHDPVDAEKLHSWFGREPNFRILVQEPFKPKPRLVCYYDRDHPDRQIEESEVAGRRPARVLWA